MPHSAKSTLAARGLRPHKSLGQNFLTDPNILVKIVESAGITSSDSVLEIGPGLGHLTRALAQRAGHVIAVELDVKLAENLARELAAAGVGNVRVIQGDILKQDVAELFSGPYKVVANIPYYITSNVIRHLLAARARPAVIVLTVQEEVARRITAEPPHMSLLAVSVQFFAVAKIGGLIPAGAFYPRPQVDSAWVILEPFVESPYPVEDVEAFFRVVRAGFSAPRKQLKNTIASGLGLTAARAGSLLRDANILPTRRAETVSLDEWVKLARVASN